jgi:hypothetical protein
MINTLNKLSDHLTCVALSELQFVDAASLQRKELERFGSVTTHNITSWREALSFLQPLRSFPRRYLVAECGAWSLVLCDMIGEPCSSDVIAHSRSTGCAAVSGIAMGIERRFSYIKNGAVIRDIHSFHEAGWENRSVGMPLPFEYEDPERRLSESMVAEYITRVTGVPFPLPPAFKVGHILGLERSWKNLHRSPKEFLVLDDLQSGTEAN